MAHIIFKYSTYLQYLRQYLRDIFNIFAHGSTPLHPHAYNQHAKLSHTHVPRGPTDPHTTHSYSYRLAQSQMKQQAVCIHNIRDTFKRSNARRSLSAWHAVQPLTNPYAFPSAHITVSAPTVQRCVLCAPEQLWASALAPAHTPGPA